MCYTFPRIVSCEYYRFASGGGQDKISALCILGLNIVNDKVTEIQTQHKWSYGSGVVIPWSGDFIRMCGAKDT